MDLAAFETKVVIRTIRREKRWWGMGRDRRERVGCMELIKTYCIHVWKSQTNWERMNTAGEQEMTVCRLLFLRNRNDSWRQPSPTQCRVISCGVLRWWQWSGCSSGRKSSWPGVSLKFRYWGTAMQELEPCPRWEPQLKKCLQEAGLHAGYIYGAFFDCWLDVGGSSSLWARPLLSRWSWDVWER